MIAKVIGNNKGNVTIKNVNIESSKIYRISGSIEPLIRLDQMNRIEVNNVSMNNSILNSPLIYMSNSN